ncbi:hypothetical protein KY285_036279 [Solanum tuberosum]|nr:hypothetical protein KY285_036279 [Solanum tuberosum]
MEKSFAGSLVTKIPITESISRKEVVMVQGVPHIKWTEDEVDTMNRIENLQYAVVGGCQIGLFRNKHILIRMTKQADFINPISKGAFYYILCKDVYSYLMHTLIYDPRFNIKEETTKTLAWISFPNLLPTYFAKECMFSLATAVGKPVQLDLATINKTHPGCARVKVLLDLKGDFPKSIVVDIVNDITGDSRKEVVHIKYDYVPKYCNECKVQGHDIEDCRNNSKTNNTGFQGVMEKRIVKEQNQQYEESTIPFDHNQPPLLENKFAALAEESSTNEACSSHNNIETNSTESVKDHINCITKDPNAKINQQQHEESSKAWVTRAFGKQNESVKLAEPEHPAPSSHSHSQVEDKKNEVTDDQQEKQFNHELEINIINVQVMSESKEQDNQVNQEFTGSSTTTGEKREASSTGDTVTGIGNADLVDVEVEQENALAIMEIPKPLQTNEQYMVHSPNKVLHDIITHNVGEVQCNVSDSNQIAKGIVETKEFDEMWDAIPLEADVSPRC